MEIPVFRPFAPYCSKSLEFSALLTDFSTVLHGVAHGLAPSGVPHLCVINKAVRVQPASGSRSLGLQSSWERGELRAVSMGGWGEGAGGGCALFPSARTLFHERALAVVFLSGS